MGGKTPETCWAVNKRQDNKMENCCIWLVIYLNWTITCSKHVEDNLSEINYWGKCATCWSFSRMCITIHGSENVNQTGPWEIKRHFKSTYLTFCACTLSVGLWPRALILHLQGESYHVHCYVSYVGYIDNYATTLDHYYWFMTVEK